MAARLEVPIKSHLVSFPERDVVLALADTATMARLVFNTDAIAELRAPKDSPSFFLDMRPLEQAEWAGDLVDRAQPAGALAPVVCLLDSGATQDTRSLRPAWSLRTSTPTRLLGAWETAPIGTAMAR